MKKSLLKVLLLSIFSTPLFASEGGGIMAVLGMVVIVGIVMLLVTIFFLLSQSSFAKAMKTQNETKNTSAIWIWTQLIPIWSLVAIPVTLIKLNEQFNLYISENNLESNTSIKTYNNTWGWVWFIGSVISLFLPIAGLISLVGVIGFWIHINGVKKSLEIL